MEQPLLLFGKLSAEALPVMIDRLDAVIFDMDGVIVDSEPLHERSFLEVFAEIGFTDNHGVDFASYYGKSDRIVWRDFIQRHQPRHTFDYLLNRKEEVFTRLLDEERPIFKGVPELLSKAASRLPVGLASGSRHSTINEVLAIGGLRRHFGAVVSSQDVQNGKPAPDIFLHTAKLLGADPAKCCVIEDSAAGVEAALAAGMIAIGITNSLPAQRLLRAHHIVSTCGDIEVILGLQTSPTT